MTSTKEIAGVVELRLHHLRRHVACAMHVHCRPTGVDGLDECPRSRRQCQGQAEPALTSTFKEPRASHEPETSRLSGQLQLAKLKKKKGRGN
jgi:hypothetical protein